MKRVLISAALAMAMAMGLPVVAQPTAAPAADAPSARQLELARQLVAASGMNATLSAGLRNSIGQLYATLKPAASADAEARRKVFADAQADATAKIVPQITESLVNGYARTFSAQELSDVLAFYQSPSGRAMVAKTPQLMQGVTASLFALIPQLRRDMGDEVCAKITCTAASAPASSARRRPSPEAGRTKFRALGGPEHLTHLLG